MALRAHRLTYPHPCLIPELTPRISTRDPIAHLPFHAQRLPSPSILNLLNLRNVSFRPCPRPPLWLAPRTNPKSSTTALSPALLCAPPLIISLLKHLASVSTPLNLSLHGLLRRPLPPPPPILPPALLIATGSCAARLDGAGSALQLHTILPLRPNDVIIRIVVFPVKTPLPSPIALSSPVDPPHRSQSPIQCLYVTPVPNLPPALPSFPTTSAPACKVSSIRSSTPWHPKTLGLLTTFRLVLGLCHLLPRPIIGILPPPLEMPHIL